MLNKKRLLQTFCELVSIDSPSFGERAVCDYITKELRELGITPIEDQAGKKIGGNTGNLYAKIPGNIALSPILLSTHMDTVEPSCNKKAIVEESGLIHSDGSTVLGADDFAGVASVIEAIRSVKEDALSHRPIELIFSVAEEPFCRGIREFDSSLIASKECYVFDLTGKVGSAANQAPTIISFTAKFLGRAAHAGFAPEEGIHSIKAAAEAISSIRCGKVDDVTVNIGTISGGTTINTVPAQCTFSGEIRSYSDEHAHEQRNLIQSACQTAANHFGASCDFSSTDNIIAYKTNEQSPVVTRFQKICQKNALPYSMTSTFGGSDNNFFALHGIEGLVLATAMNHCHSTKEYTDINELFLAATVSQDIILSKE